MDSETDAAETSRAVVSVLAAGVLGHPGDAAPSATTNSRRIIALIPAGVAAFLGLWRISSLSFTQDEAATLAAVRRPFGSMLAMLGHIDAVHGAYYVIMHLIAKLGTSEAVMRAPSVLGMAGAAWLTTVIGTRLAGAKAGLMAGMLLAVLPFSTEYARDARPFALATFFAVVAYYLFVVFAESGTRTAAVWYSCSLAACGLMNVLSLLIVISQTMTLALSPVRQSRQRLFAIAVVSAILVVFPVGWLAASQVGQVGWEQRPGIAVVLAIFVALAIAGIASWVVTWSRFGKAANVSAEMKFRATFGAAPLVRLAAPWLIMPVGLLLTASQVPVPSFDGMSQTVTGTGIWEPRYLLFCMPALALLIIALMSRLPSKAMTIAMVMPVAVAVALAGQSLMRPQVSTDDIRAVSAVLRSESRPGDAVIFPNIAKRLIKDAYPLGFRRLRDIGLDTSAAHRDSLYGLNVGNSVLQRRLAGTGRLWVVIFPVTRPAPYYGAPRVRHEFCLQRTWRFPLNMVLLYHRCELWPAASAATADPAPDSEERNVQREAGLGRIELRAEHVLNGVQAFVQRGPGQARQVRRFGLVAAAGQVTAKRTDQVGASGLVVTHERPDLPFGEREQRRMFA